MALFKKNILFVGNNPRITNLLDQVIKNAQNSWELRKSSEPAEAIRLLDEVDYQVLISELKFAETDACGLIENCINHHPAVARLIFSDPAHPELILKCTRSAHQFLPPDCPPEELQSILAQVIKLRDLMTNDYLQKIVSRIDVLPSIPIVYDEIMRELSNPSASAQSLALIIEKDISMTTQILKFVNSAFFGVFTRVKSPVQAITLLGIDTIKTLALSYEIFKLFNPASDVKFSPERIWKHSQRTAQYAKAIAAQLKGEIHTQNDAYMAGFLHDIGKLVMVAKLPEIYKEVLKLMDIMKLSQAQAEIGLMNVSHAEIGAYLLGLWGFADPITQAVALHHDPDHFSSTKFIPSIAVYAANMIESQISAGRDSINSDHPDFYRFPHLKQAISQWFKLCLEIETSGNSGS